MAELKPFRALRFSSWAGGLSALVCPPREHLRAREPYAQASPFNAVRLEMPAPGENAAALLRDWTEQGILKPDRSPAVFLYEQEFVHQARRKRVMGLLCLLKAGEEVFPFEEPDPDRVRQQFESLRQTGCRFAPATFLYEDPERTTMNRIRLLTSGTPRHEFTESGVTHRVWVVNDVLAIRAIQEDFAARRVFLADGFARRAASREYARAGGPEETFAYLADASQDGLTVMSAHCLLAGDFDTEKFLADCEPYFNVVPRGTADEIPMNLDALYRQGKNAFGVYDGGGRWTLLILKEPAVPPEFLPQSTLSFRRLDSVVLHSLILKRILRRETGISFVPTVQDAISSVRKGAAGCAVLTNPPRVGEILAVGRAGEKIPTDSAWLYPPVPAGMIMAETGDGGKS